jgi:hypothetical protein
MIKKRKQGTEQIFLLREGIKKLNPHNAGVLRLYANSPYCVSYAQLPAEKLAIF